MADTLPAAAVRIGSNERTQVAERLVAHYQAGRLSRPELELRLTKIAHAHTDDDLHLLTLDLPDVPGPARVVPALGGPARGGRTSPLRVAFDVMLLLLTFSAGICLVLLLILVGASGGQHATETIVVALLAALGAFTVGAGGVHLLHRAFDTK